MSPALKHFALATMVFGLIGCSGSGLDLHPLTGTVVRGGKGVKGGGLIFMPETPPVRGLTVSGSVGEDGSFTAETLRTASNGRTVAEPGAPAGRYRVTYHPPSDGSKSGLEVTFKELVSVDAKATTLTLALPEQMPEGQGEPRDDVEKWHGSKEARFG